MICLADVHHFFLWLPAGILAVTILAALIILTWESQRLVPSWIIIGLITFVIIYFFDQIPSQHIWNPIIRELYPQKQWKLERAIMQTLHWLHIIPRSRITRDSTRLPAEIWSIILDFTIDIPFFFDTACDAKNFNLFIHAQTYESHHLEYSTSERERKALRAVCKQWASLLDRRKMRWVKEHQRRVYSGTQVLRADFRPLWNITIHDAITQFLLASSTQVNSLTTVAIERSHTTGIPEYFQYKLAPNTATLPNLRSIILGYQYLVPTTLLLDIEQSFSRLTFLRLEGDMAYGPLRLNELEILYLDVTPVELYTWSFPSLIHLALGKRYLVDQNLDLGVLPIVTEKLHSLLLPRGHAPIAADDSFWSKLASLQFLGIAAESFSIVDKPHLLHPLAHVCLAESHSILTLGRERVPITALDFDHVSVVLQSIPNLRWVTMPTVADKRLDRYPPQWRTLFVAHRKKGVKWLDEHGMVINAMKRRETRVQKMWEIQLMQSAYIHCIVILIIGTFGIIEWSSEFILKALVVPMVVVGLPYYLWTIYDLWRN